METRMDLIVLMLMLGVVAARIDSYRTYDEGSDPMSPCAEHARTKDLEACLQAIRKRAEDPSIFWFGNAYSSTCEGQAEYMADCYNPRRDEKDSLVSRLFSQAELDPDSLDRYLEVTYMTRPGTYEACENRYSYNYSRAVTLDPMSMTVMSPFEVREEPRIWWRADDKTTLYTLVFYDVGYLSMKAMYINIPGNNFTKGEAVVKYEGPLNPTRNNNPYVFLLFRQAGAVTLDNKWKDILSKRNWDTELQDFVQAHDLEGPLALSWVLVVGDAYSAEVRRVQGFMNTCAHFVADAFRSEKLEFIPNRTYFGDPLQLNVYINVTFEATPTVVNSCCRIYSYPARTFNINPLGNTRVLPAHVRTDVIKYVTLHMATAFPDTQRDFEDKTLTLLMADPDVPLQAFGNERLPFLHWLVTNIRGGDVAAGDVVQSYMGPAPPDPKTHRYYMLLFRQDEDLDPHKLDYSAANCSWNFRGRCRYDVQTLVSENQLTLIGAAWMRVQFDDFVRQIYVGAGLNPRCVACHGVPGYADPCPSRLDDSSASIPSPGLCCLLSMLLWAWVLLKSVLCM